MVRLILWRVAAVLLGLGVAYLASIPAMGIGWWAMHAGHQWLFILNAVAPPVLGVLTGWWLWWVADVREKPLVNGSDSAPSSVDAD